MRFPLITLLVASALGIAVSLYSLTLHYGVTTGSFCTFGSNFDCGIVNQGIYSDVFGIPVALIGILGYAFLLVATILKQRSPADRSLTRFLLLASVGGFAFAVYLSGIEAFVLGTWCIVCLLSQFLIAAACLSSLILWVKEKKEL